MILQVICLIKCLLGQKAWSIWGRMMDMQQLLVKQSKIELRTQLGHRKKV